MPAGRQDKLPFLFFISFIAFINICIIVLMRLTKYFILIPIIFLCGCGVWEDFTTYFNVYYNAKTIFGQAENAIQAQDQDLFTVEEVQNKPEIEEQEPLPSNVKQQLDQVIDKCSQILQFSPTSSYVDDALLMLGKSFYYQGDYEKALRKFNELLATQPKSDLILQDKLWLGKTQLKLKDYDDALQTLDEVRKEAADKGEDDVVRDTYIEEIRYYISKEDYSGAIDFANQFLTISKDGDINAEVEYAIGRLYEILNDYNNAVTAFKHVFDYSPSYAVEFNTKMELGKALRETDHAQDAMNIFEKMRNQDKFSDSYDVIDLQIGLCQIALNDYSDALNTLLYADTTYKSSTNVGMTRFETGVLYEKYLDDFDSALVYFTKVTTSSVPLDYMGKAKDQINILDRYVDLKQNLDKDRKGLMYLTNPAVFTHDSLEYNRKLQEVMSQKIHQDQHSLFATGRERLIEQRDEEITMMAQSKTILNMDPPIRPTMPADSLKKLIIKNSFRMGNLFFAELDLPDSAYKYYIKILTDYNGSEYQAKTMFALGSYYETMNNNKKADSLYNLVYDNYKKDNIVNAAAQKLGKPFIDLNYDPAEELYSNAEKKMIQQNYNASVKDFYSIYKEHPHSDYAAKALYAAGWVLENKLNQNDSAAIFYDSVYTMYPRSIYANEVAESVSFYNAELVKRKAALRDSLLKVDTKLKDSINVYSKNIKNGKDTADIKLKKDDSLRVSIEKQIQNLSDQKPKNENASGLNSVNADTTKKIFPKR
jgi:tetratricopeptide (TPR) repeat protein